MDGLEKLSKSGELFDITWSLMVELVREYEENIVGILCEVEKPFSAVVPIETYTEETRKKTQIYALLKKMEGKTFILIEKETTWVVPEISEIPQEIIAQLKLKFPETEEEPKKPQNPSNAPEQEESTTR